MMINPLDADWTKATSPEVLAAARVQKAKEDRKNSSTHAAARHKARQKQKTARKARKRSR